MVGGLFKKRVIAGLTRNLHNMGCCDGLAVYGFFVSCRAQRVVRTASPNQEIAGQARNDGWFSANAQALPSAYCAIRRPLYGRPVVVQTADF